MTFITDQEETQRERSEEKKEKMSNTPPASGSAEEPVGNLAEQNITPTHFSLQQPTAGPAVALPHPIIISTN